MSLATRMKGLITCSLRRQVFDQPPSGGMEVVKPVLMHCHIGLVEDEVARQASHPASVGT
jgi:hypothetical protein